METFCVQHINPLLKINHFLCTISNSDLQSYLVEDKIYCDAIMCNLLDGRSSQRTCLLVWHTAEFTLEVKMFSIRLLSVVVSDWTRNSAFPKSCFEGMVHRLVLSSSAVLGQLITAACVG